VSGQDDLIGDLIAEVARTHGIAIARDDPVMAVVLLNQAVLRRYLQEAAGPAAEAIQVATKDAIEQIEKIAEAQAHWLDQVSLKDRASFLEDQKALHEAWKADMQALIEGQRSALQQVLLQTVSLLRTSSDAPRLAPREQPSQPAPARPWLRFATGALLGTGATAALALAAVVWVQLVAQ
jgi:hypothetical protein